MYYILNEVKNKMITDEDCRNQERWRQGESRVSIPNCRVNHGVHLLLWFDVAHHPTKALEIRANMFSNISSQFSIEGSIIKREAKQILYNEKLICLGWGSKGLALPFVR